MKHWWNNTDGKLEVLEEKPVPVPLYPPQTLTSTEVGSNPGICNERSATNRLRNVTALHTQYF